MYRILAIVNGGTFERVVPAIDDDWDYCVERALAIIPEHYSYAEIRDQYDDIAWQGAQLKDHAFCKFQ